MASGGVLQFAVGRLLALVPVLLGVLVLTFVVARLIPADPAVLLAGPNARPDVVAGIRSSLGLDQPLPDQFFRYCRAVLTGDLGRSIHTGQPVLRDLASRLAATAELVVLSTLLGILLAIPAALLGAARAGSAVDAAVRALLVFGAAMPSFLFGLLLLFVFYFLLGVAAPPVGRLPLDVSTPPGVTGLLLIDAALAGDWEAWRAGIGQLLLPVLTLGLVVFAPLARVLRAALVDALRSDHVRAARALGLGGWDVYVRDALRLASLPALSVGGVLVGYLLSGAVLVETVFSWPGLGRYVVDAIQTSDYAAIQGFVLLSAAIYVLVFFLVDVATYALDPRSRAAVEVRV